jgi:hypothetical protein
MHLSFTLIHILELQHALSTPKVLQTKERAQLFIFPLFSPLDLQLSLSKSLGVR